MSILKVEGVTHWSIPVNDLTESEKFYGELLGLTHKGRLGNSGMSCFNVADNYILLCQRERAKESSDLPQQLHHSFTVSPETLVKACKVFHERKISGIELIYRAKGHFTGRELYFLDPSGNRLELRDPTWKAGMPEPSYEEIVKS
jgi:extradiol dioxygenase family protein